MLKLLSLPAARPAGMVLAIMLLLPARAAPQTGAVRVEQENFRAEPRGVVLAEVAQGTTLALGDVRGRWRQATLEGWVRAESIREERRSGHELVVAAAGGETLRAAPDGAVRAHLRPGMRLDRMEALGAWLRVRREGWIWGPSLEIAAPEPLQPSTPPVAGNRAPDTSAGGAPEPAATESPAAIPTARRPSNAGIASGAAGTGSRGWAVAGPRGMRVLDRPAGDSLARIRPGAAVQIVGREGEWTRVRVEGWTYTASLGTPDSARSDVLRDPDPAAVEQDPDAYRGRLISWEVQFIALQEAERFRSDFLEGEPFILARGPGDESGFVYAAVPPSLLDDVRKLSALERVRVLGRVRTARSALTGAPVLDLLELRPVDR